MIQLQRQTLKVQDNDLWPLKDKPGYYMPGAARPKIRAGKCQSGKFNTHVLWHHGVDRAGVVQFHQEDSVYLVDSALA